MSTEVITWLKNEAAKLEAAFGPVEKVIVQDAQAIGSATLSYIENNGLKDLYTIATSVLAGAVTGTPWATLAATVVSQGEAAGIAISKGAETIVLGMAQADLIAAGTLVAPTTGAVVASVVPAVPTPSAA